MDIQNVTTENGSLLDTPFEAHLKLIIIDLMNLSLHKFNKVKLKLL